MSPPLQPVISSKRVKPEGNIGSVFATFSGGDENLPVEYARFKREIVSSPEREAAIVSSWNRLLLVLADATREIQAKGQSLIPEIDFTALKTASANELNDIRRRGCVVIRNVAQDKAPIWEEMLKSYVHSNPTQGFPDADPQVFELYWSKPQMQARSDANLLTAQKFLNGLWNCNSDTNYPVDLNSVVSYADRVRMRRPGDTQFSLGPHSDSGSIELWEDKGYRQCYDSIFRGAWEEYDPYDAPLRERTNTNLHNALAYCGVMRTWQGWLALANIGPGEGTLLNFPLLKEATAYFILRPFFKAIRAPTDDNYEASEYLDPSNWELDLDSSAYPGSVISKTQELSSKTHPHLCLSRTMVSMPRVAPGDYVAWHCEGIHAVDPEHGGSNDSTIMYIASCVLTPKNAQHLLEQRDCFAERESGPDMPGGRGEQGFDEVGSEDDIVTVEGRRAMGLDKFVVVPGSTVGAERMVAQANKLLFGVA